MITYQMNLMLLGLVSDKICGDHSNHIFNHQKIGEHYDMGTLGDQLNGK